MMPEDTQKLPELGEVGKMAHCLFKKYRGGTFNTGLKMYDSCAVAYLLCPELFTVVETYVDVELAGTISGSFCVSSGITSAFQPTSSPAITIGTPEENTIFAASGSVAILNSDITPLLPSKEGTKREGMYGD